ncbi:MAG: right-handed parallel beta-helix repeat-containing protein [Planctomycetota bacterium]|nr:right-handed parallel beta-helix repeat-containing protein [Planctomycetota bacterium]
MPGLRFYRQEWTAGVLTMLCLSLMAQGQAVRFVDDDATPGGDGLAWASAYHDLQDALDEARKPGSVITEIRIGGGLYKPDRGTGDLDTLFEMISGVSIFGGYAGLGAADPEARDPELHETELSGDLLDNDSIDDINNSRDDNTKQTMLAQDVGPGTIIDGLTFRSNSSNSSFPVLSSGGAPTWRNCRFRAFGYAGCLDAEVRFENCSFLGMYRWSLFSYQSQVTIEDCEFTGEGPVHDGAVRMNGTGGQLTARRCSFIGNGVNAWRGGAITVESGNELTAIDCHFESNGLSSGDGGSIHGTECDIRLQDCVFLEHHVLGGFGAALYVEKGGRIELTGCEFRNNSSRWGLFGGAVYCSSDELIVNGCRFESNHIYNRNGGALAYFASDSATSFEMNDCEFINNGDPDWDGVTRDGEGGAFFVCLNFRPVTLRRCRFVGNTIGLYGGAGYVLAGSLLIEDCIYQDNRAKFGGAMFAQGMGDVVIRRSRFVGNEAQRNGGALQWGSSLLNLLVQNSIFAGNMASGDGGAIHSQSRYVRCENVLFNGNRALARGGAYLMRIRSDSSIDPKADFINCNFVDNQATQVGGLAIRAITSESNLVTITNTIFWGNADDQPDVEQAQLAVVVGIASFDVNHSIVQGLSGEFGGTGNLGDDPLFVDPDGPDDIPGTEDDDLHLAPDSPAIDVGDNIPVLLAGIEFDLDGNARIVNEVVDLGPYESFIPPCPADIFPPNGGDGVVNVRDLLFVLRQWGNPHDDGGTPPRDRGRPFNVEDLLFIIGNWGPCPK